MLKHDIDIRNFGDNSHQDGDVGMSQDGLHDDLVLDFLKELVCQSRVEDLLDGHGGTVKLALVNHTEAALANLLTEFEV